MPSVLRSFEYWPPAADLNFWFILSLWMNVSKICFNNQNVTYTFFRRRSVLKFTLQTQKLRCIYCPRKCTLSKETYNHINGIVQTRACGLGRNQWRRVAKSNMDSTYCFCEGPLNILPNFIIAWDMQCDMIRILVFFLLLPVKVMVNYFSILPRKVFYFSFYRVTFVNKIVTF